MLSVILLGQQARVRSGCQVRAPAARHSVARHSVARHSPLGSGQGGQGQAPAAVLTPVQQLGSLRRCGWDSACAFPCSCRGSAAGTKGRLWHGEVTCHQVEVEWSHRTIPMPVCALGRVSVLVSNVLSCSWRRAGRPPFSQLPGATQSGDPCCCLTTLRAPAGLAPQGGRRAGAHLCWRILAPSLAGSPLPACAQAAFLRAAAEPVTSAGRGKAHNPHHKSQHLGFFAKLNSLFLCR